MKNTTNQELRMAIRAIELSIPKVRWDFEEFIKNKEVPLEERWTLFCDTPMYFKNHDNWISDGRKVFGNELMIIDGPIYLERYMRVDIVEAINILEEDEAFGESLEDKYGVSLTDIKERAMLHNLGSFVFDW